MDGAAGPAELGAGRNVVATCNCHPALASMDVGRTGSCRASARRRTLAFLAQSGVCEYRLPRLRGRCACGRAVGLGTHLRPGPSQGDRKSTGPAPVHAAVYQSPACSLARGGPYAAAVLACVRRLGGADVQLSGVGLRVVDDLPWSDATGRSRRRDRSVVGAPCTLCRPGGTAGRGERSDRLAPVARGPRRGRRNRPLARGA